MRTVFTVIAIITCLGLQSMAQGGKTSSAYKRIYPIANKQLEAKKYPQAAKNFLELLELNPKNFNFNYKVGVCYLGINGDKHLAVPYLEAAASNVSSKYKDNFKETSAPEDAFLQLARAYHLASQYNNAIASYEKYKSKVSKADKEQIADLDRQIEMCKNGSLIAQQPISAEVTRLGDNINSIYDEYSPVIDASETTMIFTSRRPNSTGRYVAEDEKYFEDIYVSMKKDGEWQSPVSIGDNINTEGHEATISLSADGQRLFIYRDDFGDGNIYESRLDGGVWQEPVMLNDNINSTFRETHVSITANGQLLYFTSDRAGDSGMDIYQAGLLPNGDWGKPVKLNDKINTPFDEEAPFIHPDGKTLFFSSKGHTSMGGYDIFFSVMDEKGNWSTPMNMGIPVNTADDEYFFNTSPDGRRGYYSSSNQSGKGGKDIFMMNMGLEEEIPLTVYRGVFAKGADGKLPPNAFITVSDNETGNMFGVYKPRNDNGTFILILHPGNNYNIAYEAEGYMYRSEKLFVPENTAYFEIHRTIELKKMVLKNK
ncbi:MAG: tetratricopeptide (TPR) repeat protein [Bacteroidia bacterium]|jgi:tetratricopeptide (TPR) repeat protein